MPASDSDSDSDSSAGTSGLEGARRVAPPLGTVTLLSPSPTAGSRGVQRWGRMDLRDPGASSGLPAREGGASSAGSSPETPPSHKEPPNL